MLLNVVGIIILHWSPCTRQTGEDLGEDGIIDGLTSVSILIGNFSPAQSMKGDEDLEN
jgi:hypothetical protein